MVIDKYKLRVTYFVQHNSDPEITVCLIRSIHCNVLITRIVG